MDDATRAAIEDPHRSEEALTSAAYEANRLMGAAGLLGGVLGCDQFVGLVLVAGPDPVDRLV
ncbi:hypothetical protein OIU91_04500 [Streptomyces sp. NBC_01456]|uniref:hypothetical protein n=1 Tax=unclassified Streptomyces TaxID=2593676 RepID=UPI002E31C5A9|nr:MULTISPECIES: hypothetical protein [unclassified Streptomyces]